MYLTTGNPKDIRLQQLRALATRVSHPETALSILGGDFNFVADNHDRANVLTATTTLRMDIAETSLFKELLSPKRVFELEQDDLTHRSSTGSSRLDRIYANYNPAQQLDHQILCTTLPWPDPGVSAHRPVLGSCKAPRDKDQSAFFLDEATVHDPQWPHRVWQQFTHTSVSWIGKRPAGNTAFGISYWSRPR